MKYLIVFIIGLLFPLFSYFLVVDFSVADISISKVIEILATKELKQYFLKDIAYPTEDKERVNN